MSPSPSLDSLIGMQGCIHLLYQQMYIELFLCHKC